MSDSVPDKDDAGSSERLCAGLAQLQLNLPPQANEQLLAYLNLLARWNRTYNLTAVRRMDDMVTQHVLDSLAIIPAIEKSSLVARHLRIADIGSGAGLPGIPLAIAHPDWRMTLVEAVAKKAAFLRQVHINLGLTNVCVMAQRVEGLPAGQMDLAISRAFSSLAEFVRCAGHLVCEGGLLCAMKGVRPDAEIKELPPEWRLVAMNVVRVPGLDAQRHVLFLRRS